VSNSQLRRASRVTANVASRHNGFTKAAIFEVKRKFRMTESNANSQREQLDLDHELPLSKDIHLRINKGTYDSGCDILVA
jgi:hypothetical protein